MNKWIGNPVYFKRKIEHSFSSSRNKGDFLCSLLTCVCYHQLPTLWWGGAEEGVSHNLLKALKTFMFQDRRCWFPRQLVQKQHSIQQIAQRRGLLPLWLQEDPRSTGTPRSGAWCEGCLSRVTCPALCWSIGWIYVAPQEGFTLAFNSEPMFPLLRHSDLPQADS